MDLTASGINYYLSSLTCGNAKHAYYRAIRALCNWLFRNDYLEDNHLKKVDPPKPTKRILPSLTVEQLNNLLEQAVNPRDKTIISLFADSGMRLSELTNVKITDIDWDTYTITIWGKGVKQRKAPFTERTANLIKEWLPHNGHSNNIWGMTRRGIQSMLNDYKEKTGLPCNAHTFRRTLTSSSRALIPWLTQESLVPCWHSSHRASRMIIMANKYFWRSSEHLDRTGLLLN